MSWGARIEGVLLKRLVGALALVLEGRMAAVRSAIHRACSGSMIGQEPRRRAIADTHNLCNL
jgi:hypothetical protein